MPNNEVAFIDGIVEAIKQILTNGSAMLHQSVQEMMPLAVGVSVRTPYPVPQNGFFFGKPTDEPWISLYSYYSDVVLPITVLLFGVSIGVIMFTGTFGALLTGYEKSKAQRRLFIGFLFILAWWGLGSFTLRFADAIATSIAPDPNSVATAFTSKMSLSGTGMVTRAIMVFAEAIIVIGVVLWFLLRWIGIYALMLAMPIAVALWMAGVGGPLRYLSNLIEELAFKFIPLAFISIPVAVVYRVGDLLFQAYNPAAEFGNPIAPFVLVLGFPLLTLVSSYYVFFKAPSIGIVSRGQAPSSTEREAIQKGRAEVEVRVATEPHL
ncbi:MAG: hypothetical protein SV760_00160 [Halobacteria archaeon]|nr:hypothetical protein [Halobacteria archaeon]